MTILKTLFYFLLTHAEFSHTKPPQPAVDLKQLCKMYHFNLKTANVLSPG